jgi:hypothetical protein
MQYQYVLPICIPVLVRTVTNNPSTYLLIRGNTVLYVCDTNDPPRAHPVFGMDGPVRPPHNNNNNNNKNIL